MKFLSKIFDNKFPEQYLSSDEIDRKPSVYIETKRKKQELKATNMKTTKSVRTERNEEGSRIMSFFKGIAPTVEKFSEEDIVEFQFEVMKTIKNIVQRGQIASSLDHN